MNKENPVQENREQGNAAAPDDIIQNSRVDNTARSACSAAAATASTLQREKLQIAYPKAMERKQQLFTGKTASVAGAHAVGGVGEDSTPAQEYFEDESPPLPIKKTGKENPSNKISNPSYISYLDERSSFAKNNTKGLGEEENPAYISYLDERPPSNSQLPENLLEPMNIMPAPLPNNDDTDRPPPPRRPGAYAATTDLPVQRLDQLPFSLIGQSMTVQEIEHDESSSSPAVSTTTGPSSEQQLRSYIERGDDQDIMRMERGEQYIPCSATTNPDDNSNSNDGLVEALPVSDTFDRPSQTMMAQPVDQGNLDQQAARGGVHKRIGCCIVAVAYFILMISLAIIFTTRKVSNNGWAEDNRAPSPSPTARPLPPMENLELLYHELPEISKESLYDTDSHQYQAWEWLLNHPNITIYPEWRKKQVFAMATLFFSFEGPSWLEKTTSRDRWLDVHTSECDWALTELEIGYYVKVAYKVLGPDAYEEKDYQLCNDDGELQTLIMHQLFLPTDLIPSVPAEIGMLTSLRILGFAVSQLNVQLSDLLLPLIDLPNLRTLNLRSNGAFGTIPQEIGLMTGLRHLVIGGNALSGTIPTEIAKMTSLKHVNIGDEEGLTGELPSQLGLMTGLTGLEIYRSSVSGTIPSQLGSLTDMRELAIAVNRNTGTIPSELGLMSAVHYVYLDSNSLTGSIPSELGLMTNAIDLRLGNYPVEDSSPSQLVYRNNLSGSLPNEIWSLSHLQWLLLSFLPNLHGSLPEELVMPNLTMLSLSGSPHLSGIIPDQVCIFVDELDFDCSALLCGCDCQCEAGSTNETNLRA